MAVISLGGIVADIRGKLGGIVFSKNSSGGYVRQNTKPVNPQSALQNVLRAIFTTLVTAWRETLTESQREGWGVYAKNVVVKNKVGNDIYLSGFNHFIRSGTPRVQAGLDYIEDAPGSFSLADQDPTVTFSPSESAQTADVVFDTSKAWLDEDGSAMLIYGGIPVDPTINFFDGPYRYMDKIEGDSVTPPTSPATMAEPWPVVEDQRQYAYGRISLADGRLSEKFPVYGSVLS